MGMQMRDKARLGSTPSTQGCGMATCARAGDGRSTMPRTAATTILPKHRFVTEIIILASLDRVPETAGALWYSLSSDIFRSDRTVYAA
jgi:hypothetical protein